MGDYRYPFQSFPGRLLYAGHLPNGQQVLVGPLPPHAIVLRFAPGGELAAVEKHPLPELWDRDDLEREVLTCFAGTGAVPGTIRVRRFSSGNPGSLLEEIEKRDGCIIGIRQHLQSNSAQYFSHSPKIHYKDPLCRLGYLFWYLISASERTGPG
jgi:hypothetical protein